RGPEEGRDRRLRVQGISERGRGCGRAASRRARGGRGRHPGSGLRRGGEAVRREERSESDRGRRDRALPREPDRLQGTAFRRVPAGAAEEQRRQSPAARAEGERGGSEPERARGEVERYADESADERPV